MGKLTALFLVGLKQSGQVFALPKERHIGVNQEVTTFGPILHDGKFTFITKVALYKSVNVKC